MKKVLAVSTALLIFSASITPVFAGGAAYHTSQRRARSNADAWKQKTKEAWEKFDTEMSVVKKGSRKATSKTDTEKRQK